MEAIRKGSATLRTGDHGEDMCVAYSGHLKGFVTDAEDGPTIWYYWSIVRDNFLLLWNVEASNRVSIPIRRFVVHIRGVNPGDVGISNTG